MLHALSFRVEGSWRRVQGSCSMPSGRGLRISGFIQGGSPFGGVDLFFFFITLKSRVERHKSI